MRRLVVIICGLFLLAATSNAQTAAAAAKLYSNLNGKQDTVQIDLLCQLAWYQIEKVGEFKTDLDSAANFIERADAINTKLKDAKCAGWIELVKSAFFEEKRETPKAQDEANTAVRTLTATNGNFSLLGEAWFQLSRFYSLDDSTVKKKEGAVANATLCFHKDSNAAREGYCHQFLGDILVNEYELDRAETELELALQMQERMPGSHLEGVYDLLGYNNTRLGNYEKAVQYGLLALKAIEDHDKHAPMMVTICARLAYAYGRMEDYAKAEVYIMKALPLAERIGWVNDIYVVAKLAVGILSKEHRPAEALRLLKEVSERFPAPKGSDAKIELDGGLLQCYTDLNQLGPGQQICKHLLWSIEERHITGLEFSDKYTTVILFYTKFKLFDSAKKYLQTQELQIERAGNNMDLLTKNKGMWFKYDTSRHDYRTAVADQLQYQRLHDSSLNEKKIKTIASLETKYESEKKEVQLKLKDQDIQMLTQKEQLQHSDLKRAELFRNVMIATGCLLLIILALVYYQYRLKHGTNALISEKNRFMQQLLVEKEGLLEEKEVLLEDNQVLMKELHHRVKNNLHMISSLLENQSAYLEDEALYAVQKSQHRIQAISLIHQRLYVNDKLTNVLMSNYLPEIVSYLRDSFVNSEQLVFQVDVDPIEIDVAQAVPVGLIVNEAITNSIKYAFPDERTGSIEVSLKESAPGQVTLIITDDGIGIPRTKHFAEEYPGNSLGMSLIEGLSKSLHGSVSIRSHNGTTIAVTFPLVSSDGNKNALPESGRPALHALA